MYTAKIERVSKSYRKFQALNNIDLRSEKGTITPNDLRNNNNEVQRA